MTINEYIVLETKRLKLNNIDDSTIIIKQILSYTLNKDQQYFVINGDKELQFEEEKNAKEAIDKIISGIPIQYITNKQEFMTEEYYVDENVLIPQPDTEILVEEVLKICANNNCNAKILDLCTGSGAIAISLKKRIMKSTMFASDVSIKALNIARKNANINGTEINFIESDLFDKIQEKDFDIIVSNPPYIKKEVLKTLSKQVQNEPTLALDGGKSGLEFYEKIANEAYIYIKNNGFLCLEIGYDQAKEVEEILIKNKYYKDMRVIKDLSNNDRCIISKIVK